MLKLEISYNRVIIISRRILVSCRRISINSYFCLKILLNVKWQGHTMSHTPCLLVGMEAL